MPGPTFAGGDKGFTMTTATTTRFRAVMQVTNESVKQADTAGARCVGICQEQVSTADATAGRVANVRMEGISRAIAGDTSPTRGTRVTTDNQGRLVAATTGNTPIGVVVSAPGTPAAGDWIDVELTPGLPVV